MISMLSLIGLLICCLGVFGMLIVIRRKDKLIEKLKELRSIAEQATEHEKEKFALEKETKEEYKKLFEQEAASFISLRTQINDYLDQTCTVLAKEIGYPIKGEIASRITHAKTAILMLIAHNKDNNAEVNRKITIINNLQKELNTYKYPLCHSLKFGQKILMEGEIRYFNGFYNDMIHVITRQQDREAEHNYDLKNFEEGLKEKTIIIVSL